MTNKAFKRGFVDGFTAPFSFFDRWTMKPDDYQATVGQAWKDVGDAFRESMPMERGESGEERNKKKQPAAGKRAA